MRVAEKLWRESVADCLRCEGLENAADSFMQCGHVRSVTTCSHDQAHFSQVNADSCHLRFCPRCARLDTQRVVAKYKDKIQLILNQNKNSNYRLRVITLTTNCSVYDEDIDQKFRDGFQSVSSLFDRILCDGKPYWSQRSHRLYSGEGFLAAAEFGESGHKLHFHVLFYGRYIDQKVLSREWANLTGNQVVWIEALRPGLKLEKALKEVLKYITKFSKAGQGDHPDFPDPFYLAQVAKVYHATRRVRTRGVFYGLPTPEEIMMEDTTPVACPECLARLVVFPAADWDRMYGVNAAERLHLKQGNKFFSGAPPGRIHGTLSASNSAVRTE